MPIVTTYVCDVSGKSGTELKDFVDVTVFGQYSDAQGYRRRGPEVKKMLHKEIAEKLGYYLPPDKKPDEAGPKPSFEDALKELLRPMIEEIAQEVMDNP